MNHPKYAIWRMSCNADKVEYLIGIRTDETEEGFIYEGYSIGISDDLDILQGLRVNYLSSGDDNFVYSRERNAEITSRAFIMSDAVEISPDEFGRVVLLLTTPKDSICDAFDLANEVFIKHHSPA